jgi:pimeloyl-ACP methyl ester carboxylesterase
MAAARYWRWLFLGELCCAAAIVALPEVTDALSLTTKALLIAFITLCVFPFLLVGASFIAVRFTLTRPRVRSTGVELLRAWVTETLAFQRAMLAMSIQPWRRSNASPRDSSEPHPVLLIHGVNCNRGVWGPMAKVLTRRGFGPVRAVDLEPLLADIETHAAYVTSELRQLRKDCGGAPVAIVAHSMGGLVARAVLRAAGPDDIRQIITLASPHHGTSLACLLGGGPREQMRLDSTWLAALNSAQEGRFPVPVTSIYSIDDNLIAPPTSARLAGASLCELRGVGHLGHLSARESIECTLVALSRSHVREQTCPT